MMKKILSLAVAAALALTLSLSAFAAAGDTNMLLEIGDVFGTLVQSEIIDVSAGGEFTLTTSLDSSLSTSADASFIGVKTTAGNVTQQTALADGTVVTVTGLSIDGTEVSLDAAASESVVENGVLDGNNGVVLLFKMGGLNALTGDVPAGFTSVTVTFTVTLPGEESSDAETAEPETAEPETAEPETVTEPETTPEPETTAPAETGIALALVPMAIAAAGVVISKRR